VREKEGFTEKELALYRPYCGMGFVWEGGELNVPSHLSHSELEGHLLTCNFSQRLRTTGKEGQPVRSVHKKGSTNVL